MLQYCEDIACNNSSQHAKAAGSQLVLLPKVSSDDALWSKSIRKLVETLESSIVLGHRGGDETDHL